jgi:hypothetical protein
MTKQKLKSHSHTHKYRETLVHYINGNLEAQCVECLESIIFAKAPSIYGEECREVFRRIFDNSANK